MYPQTHVYFAENVLGKQGDIITLGSILPDMIIGKHVSHYEAHCKGMEIYNLISKDSLLPDLKKAVSTHGFAPKGLDYYGDEKFLDYERGYCFEKARPFIAKTVAACNIPEEMGWWKAHNIIEMGIETIISATDHYHQRVESALYNKTLIHRVDNMLQELLGENSVGFAHQVERFAGFIEMERATAESLAKKYSTQMQRRHHVEIDVPKVTRLINDAAEQVTLDLKDFFTITSRMVKKNISDLFKE